MSCTVGVVGASGALGKEMIQVLRDRKFPLKKLVLFASERSAGKVLTTAFGKMKVELFTVAAAQECDYVLLAVSAAFSTEFSQHIVANGRTCVIDNSSAFRYDDRVPLIVPEINSSAMRETLIIANPSCTTAIAAMALWPLHQRFKLREVIMSTCQVERKVLWVWETQKIFGSNEFAVSCTAGGISTLRAHSETITIETQSDITDEAVREVLSEAAGVSVADDPSAKRYPMPNTATKKHNVEVGRLRPSLIFEPRGLDFVSSDQLLRGAALNAVLIAERKHADRDAAEL